MWTALVFTTYVFISVSRSIRARVEEDDSLVSVDTRAIAGKLRWFPLVFALVGCLVGCRCIRQSQHFCRRGRLHALFPTLFRSERRARVAGALLGDDLRAFVRAATAVHPCIGQSSAHDHHGGQRTYR